MTWIGAAFLVGGFVILLHRFQLVTKSGDVVVVARRSYEVIRNAELGDDVKEAALQNDAKKLFGLFIVLSAGGMAAVLIPAGGLWVVDRLGWVSAESVYHAVLSPWFLVISSVLAGLVYWMSRKQTPVGETYSFLDRSLHRIAFSSYGAQTALADLEDRLFADSLNACPAERPVFIAGLPRGGTTLLLECCTQLPEFASHHYRHMPFVMIPCLWNRFSATFQREGPPRERAHGDGMLINFDSPEALEEVIWKTFWPEHYGKDRVLPWQDENHAEFVEFFGRHMRKIIHLRRESGVPAGRYISKNNLNIARTRMLRTLFPDATIVVPFRDPFHHAASLLDQHRNFLRIHSEDAFACQYMRAIGHFDFGDNLRPVDFAGWFDQRASRDTESLAFWIEYWLAAYRQLLADQDGLYLISYEALCQDPTTEFRRLAGAIGTPDANALIAAAGAVRSPRARAIDVGSLEPSLMKEAQDLHGVLCEAARASRHGTLKATQSA